LDINIHLSTFIIKNIVKIRERLHIFVQEDGRKTKTCLIQLKLWAAAKREDFRLGAQVALLVLCGFEAQRSR